MLTTPEKILFTIASVFAILVAFRISRRITKIIRRGHGEIEWRIAYKRLGKVLVNVISLRPTFRMRIGPSILHALVAWAFIYYLIVNFGDFLEGFLPGFLFLGNNFLGNFYRLIADVISISALFGMVGLLVRRFIIHTPGLSARKNVMLHPKARAGIRRDSAIVGGFILIHISARFLGQSFKLASGIKAPWQPFAGAVSNLWLEWGDSAIMVGEHLGFWLALGSILVFIPYFLYSKHIHLFFAPINYLLKPERRSPGELLALDFEDEKIDQFGTSRIEDFGWEQLMDAFACIMCYRCQKVCPAYDTGKVLSPAALEINKRYFLNIEGEKLARGEESESLLTETIISAEAIWACTACGACIDICPVGNEPMRDILDIRRSLVLMENDFPEQLQIAFRGMERTLNPWNLPPTERMKWAEGLEVPTIDENPEPDILWWVGCAPATDAQAQKSAQAFVKILNTAGVNYAVLGERESCTGDSARRAGNEYLFFELAQGNVELLNDIRAKRIVTTCPHCLHTLKNEYPAFGGRYEVMHHSQLINELFEMGKLNLSSAAIGKVAFHDPCYLGRQNGIINDPRQNLKATQADLIELPRNGLNSFCCGAGGAQMWKEEQSGDTSVNIARFLEAQATGVGTLAVACPFCKLMLVDAANDTNSDMQIKDIAEIVANQLD